jgi:hypothetical protein
LTVFASPAVRILAILASGWLVVAFALAVTLPPDFTLAQVITRWSEGGVGALERLLTGLSPWAWQSLAMPMLARPAWLLPVDFALILAGVAGSLALRHASVAQRGRG